MQSTYTSSFQKVGAAWAAPATPLSGGYHGRRALLAPSRRVRAQINGSADVADEAANAVQQERFISLTDILNEARELGGDQLVFQDFGEDDVWELEKYVRGDPLKAEDIDAMEDFTLDNSPQPAAAEEAMVSAYSPEAGFLEMTVAQLHDALQQKPPSAPSQPSPTPSPARPSGGCGCGSSSGGGCGGGGHSASTRGVAVVLDVRGAHEFEAGHVPGAINVPMGDLSVAAQDGRLDTLESAAFAVICATGQRSAQACVRLSKVLGFVAPVNVQGGMQAWKQAGYPTEVGS